MARWLTAADTDALAYIWPDAPTEEPAILALYLAAAKAACVAYAPARDEQGEMTLGPSVVSRRNLIPAPRGGEAWERNGSSQGGTVSYENGWTVITPSVTTGAGSDAALAVRAETVGLKPSTDYTMLATIRVYPGSFAGSGTSTQTNSIWFYIAGALRGYAQAPGINVPGEYTLRLHFRTPDSLVGLTSMRLYSGRTAPAAWREFVFVQGTYTGPYFDGNSAPVTIDARTLTYGWAGAENASPSIETYRPFVFEPSIPDEWVLAQAMQARNIYNAGGAAGGPSSDPTAGGYGIATSYPLDWHVKQLLRPAQGMGAIL